MKPVDRLAWYLKHKKIKYGELERQTGLVHGYMSKQVRSSASIGSDILERICNACSDLNPAWLLTGKGHWDLNITETGALPVLQEDDAYKTELEYIRFIDGLAVSDGEKYRLSKAHAEKLVWQMVAVGKGRQENEK